MDLSVSERHGVRVLTTNRALKENQIIGNASSLLFSRPGILRDFLNLGGNAALMDAPIVEAADLAIPSQMALDAGGDQTHSVFGVFVGAMRLLTDHRS